MAKRADMELISQQDSFLLLKYITSVNHSILTDVHVNTIQITLYGHHSHHMHALCLQGQMPVQRESKGICCPS